MDEVLKDDRFSHIAKDPRFWEMPKNERKVKIDKRFKAMFTDKRFQVKYTVDKRGRPIDTSSKDNLRKYYDVSDSDEEEEEDAIKKPKKKKEKNKKENLSKAVSDKPKTKKKGKVDIDSSSKEDSEKKIVKKKNKIDNDSSTNGVSEKPGLKKKNNTNIDSVKKTKLKNDDKKISVKKLNKNGKSQPERIKKSQKNESAKFEINMNEDDDEEDDDDDEDVDSEEDDVDTKKNKSRKNDRRLMEINMDEGEEEDEVSDQDQDSSSGDEEDDESDEDGDSEDDDSDYDGSDEEVDRARGIGGVSSSSEEEEFEFDGDDAFDHDWMEMDKNVPEAKDSSHRLAVCNLDWDRIKAEDIYLMLNSFKPTNGYIQSVTIYPSEFGLERMKEEEIQGPKELVQKPDTSSDLLLSSKTSGQDEEFNRERLRQYQINRLKYYYAVVVCDSVHTAAKLYDDCDGIEFETSCTKVDLRFIPDGMTFEQEPKSICTGVEEYKPNYFANSALGSSKVQLTWDDNDRDRLRVTMTKVDPKKIEDLEKEYENYIASSSDEDEGDERVAGSGSSVSDSDEETEESRLQKYRELIQEIDDKKAKKEEEDVEMEITWEPGLKGTAESLVKQSAEAEKTVTPWQEFLKKKKEKKKQKVKDRKEAKQRALIESGEAPEERAAFSDDELPVGVDLNDPYFKSEMKDVPTTKKKKKGRKEDLTEEELEQRKQDEAKLKLLMMDEDDHRNHFSLDKLVKDAKKTKKKKKRLADDEDDNEQADDFQLDVADPRFSAMYDSHLFNVDPSAPEFKKTEGSQQLIKEKQKRRQKEGYFKPTNLKRKATDCENNDTAAKRDNTIPKESISSLVKSVKVKTQKFQESKKKKS